MKIILLVLLGIALVVTATLLFVGVRVEGVANLHIATPSPYYSWAVQTYLALPGPKGELLPVLEIPVSTTTPLPK